MALSPENAHQAFHQIVRKYLGDALNPVFQGTSEMASRMEGNQQEIRLSLLEELETAFASIMTEKKERANRPQTSVAARGRTLEGMR